MLKSLCTAMAAFMIVSSGSEAIASTSTDTIVYNLKDFGLRPGANRNSSPAMQKALQKIAATHATAEAPAKIVFPKGEYHFFEKGSSERELYISNHDQANPKHIGLLLEGMKNVTIEGNGSELIFHGRMLPIAMICGYDCQIKNLEIDFFNPYITQVEILENDPEEGITYKVAPWVKYEVRDSDLHSIGDGWETVHSAGIAFNSATGALVYKTSDIGVGTRKVYEIAPRTIKAPKWNDARLVPGTIVALRGGDRPAPGIFLHSCKNTGINNVKVHYAEGMGLLAQLCKDITLAHFGVCLRGENDPRYFTTQADATHFSGCKGLIRSVDGLYEGMMDDAINVHGTYLKVMKVEKPNAVVGRYMHGQSYGFDWGFPGDSVVFVKSNTMDVGTDTLIIKEISALDAPTAHGAKEFKITFDRNVPGCIDSDKTFGIENITWTPSVIFSGNVVRNNRARGALFSTPKPVLVENNFFDHTSGTAILLCGDCNGWYETGSCRNVTIRGNHFFNSLTNMFQFTNAVISIYPEIPDLGAQKNFFHSGIVIEDNKFDAFDKPLLYAKSVRGLTFRNNSVRHNQDFKPMHWNQNDILLERVVDCTIEANESDAPVVIKIN